MGWEEISTVAARDKVSHALRTKKAAWKRQQQHLLQLGGASDDNDNDNGSSHSQSHSHSTPPPSRKSSIKEQRSRQQQQHKNNSSTMNNIDPISFDSNDGGATGSVVTNLMKAQQEIYASLNMIPPSQFPQHQQQHQQHQHQHQYQYQQRRSGLDFSMHDRTYGSL